MRENRRLLRSLSLVVAVALAVPAVMFVSVPQARADEAGERDPDRVRRRLMWGAVALSGAGLLAGMYAHSRYTRGVRLFNEYQTPSAGPGSPPDLRCAANRPDRGGGACASLLDSAENARTAFQVSLAVAGAAAVTAVMLKLVEPDAPPRKRVEGWALACAPIPGAGGTCTVRF